MSTKWPTRTDFSNAIQNNKSCFKSIDLKKGKVKTNPLGLPIGASGAYAIVYELKSGRETYAIRCFTRPVTNQGKRYETLSRFLSNIKMDSLVEFDYLPEGIRVNGSWYPVLKMEWITGMLLTEYVRVNLRKKNNLNKLVNEWKKVVFGLNKNGIAHGDLQHGNVIVQNNGKIRLVDYDSFFIPSLKKYAPSEAGHPNYQHPGRNHAGCYDENIDNFPALVIYLSLIALISDSKLWGKFNNGGDNLIFTSRDLENPGTTQVWRELCKSKDKKVLEITDKLLHFCKKPISNIPKLEVVLNEKTAVKPPKPYTLPKPPNPKPKPLKPKPKPKPKPNPKPKPFVPWWCEEKKHTPKPRPWSPKPINVPPSGIPTTNQNKCACGFKNGNDDIYCQKCASVLLAGNSWCSSCEKPIPRRARFCIRCGTRQ